MGKNKDIREKIAGHERVIQQHRNWIMYGKEGNKPTRQDIEKWQSDIARHQRIIEKLKDKLP